MRPPPPLTTTHTEKKQTKLNNIILCCLTRTSAATLHATQAQCGGCQAAAVMGALRTGGWQLAQMLMPRLFLLPAAPHAAPAAPAAALQVPRPCPLSGPHHHHHHYQWPSSHQPLMMVRGCPGWQGCPSPPRSASAERYHWWAWSWLGLAAAALQACRCCTHRHADRSCMSVGLPRSSLSQTRLCTDTCRHNPHACAAQDTGLGCLMCIAISREG